MLIDIIHFLISLNEKHAGKNPQLFFNSKELFSQSFQSIQTFNASTIHIHVFFLFPTC